MPRIGIDRQGLVLNLVTLRGMPVDPACRVDVAAIAPRHRRIDLPIILTERARPGLARSAPDS